ncbi:MAG: RHS repeat protein [Betaproteobacteria bacterium]|nr:RHS repeat protein [Betaproteobacteria bacterium]
MVSQTDAKGQVTTYAYDALNRPVLITFHDGVKHALSYDQGANGIGRLTAITETSAANAVTSQIAYAYDVRGRVTSETRTLAGVPYVTGYAYDSAGRMSGVTYPGGRTVSYGFDALGRVNQVSTSKDSVTQVVVQNVQYHPFGGVKSWTMGNGQIYARSIDLYGRIGAYSLGSASHVVGFDAASRITGIAQAGNPANANTYGYDALDRLTSAVLPNNSHGYGYDAVGNRLTKTTGTNTDTYAYGATSNRLATITPASGPVRSVVMDANGSTTNDAVNQFGYDARGRMIQATTAQGATGYQVNALGQRVRKTDSANDVLYHYDTGGRLIAETSSTGEVQQEYLYLGDVPVAVVR